MESLKRKKEKQRHARGRGERLGLRNFYHNSESYLKKKFFSGKEKMREKKKDEKLAEEGKKK